MNRTLFRYSLQMLMTAVLSLASLGVTHANISGPDDLLRSTTHEVFQELNQNRTSFANNPTQVRQLLEKHLLPHVDIITASKWVMGKYWRTASKEQKLRFITEFRTLLLRFYSSALAEYLDTSHEVLDEGIIHFFPIRNKPDDTDITVRGEVRPKSGKPFPINFSMHLTEKGWKVYDVSVEGVSIITTYKNNFASEIKEKGIDGLIDSIADRNAELLAKNNTAEKNKKQ